MRNTFPKKDLNITGNNMKKRIMIMLIFAIVASTVGCAKKADEVSNSVVEGTSEIAATSNASDESNLLFTAEEKSDLIASQEKADVLNHMKSPKSREEVNIDAESIALYDAFLADEAKATFFKNGDYSELFYLSGFLENGENYTLSEIVDRGISNIRDRDHQNWIFDGSTDSYIDCGLDGNIEMIVNLQFESYFTTYMVIKNVAGNLKICFAGSTNGRHYTDIEYNGVVSSDIYYGREHHIGDYAYIDAEGNYNSWYETDDRLYFDDNKKDNTLYCNNDSNEPQIIKGAEELCLCSIKFDNEQKYALIYLADSAGNDIEDVSINGVNPYDEARKILIKENDYTIISSEDATTIIENRRREIGLMDGIYSYDEVP